MKKIARRKAELKPYEPNVKGYLKRYAAQCFISCLWGYLYRIK